MILPNYPAGDILIKRVANGWMAISMNVDSPGELAVFVYEDPEAQCWAERSLAALFVDQFRHYMQDDGSAGIKVEVSDMSKEAEANAKEQQH